MADIGRYRVKVRYRAALTTGILVRRLFGSWPLTTWACWLMSDVFSVLTGDDSQLLQRKGLARLLR